MTDGARQASADTDKFRSRRISFGIEERSAGFFQRSQRCGYRVISQNGALFAATCLRRSRLIHRRVLASSRTP